MSDALFLHDDVSYDTQNIVDALRQAGVEAGDSLYVHSALMSFGKLVRGVKRNAFTGAFIEALQEVVGASGNVMMPTYSYSFCKQEVFDVENTPSTVGLLTEAFRKRPQAMRSVEGIFSSAIEGPDADVFLPTGPSCFGTDSIFEKLYDRDVKFVFLGETFDLTFIHFVEQRLGIPYRYIKAFPGQVLQDGKTWDTVAYYNVRYLDYSVDYDMEKLAASMAAAGLVSSAALGASKIRTITARKTYDHISQGLCGDLDFLLTASPELPPHATATS